MKFLDVPQSGSIADRTHSHNRAGQYTRNRRAPVQPIGSGRRAAVRALFGAASAAWGGLTDANRAGWDSFALDHPITDSLGSSIILTGHQMFVRVYASAVNGGLLPPTGPISDLDLPSLSPTTFVPDLSTGLTVNAPVGAAQQIIVFAFSRPMSPGRSFNKTFWQPMGAAGYSFADTTPYILPVATYAAEFGTPVAGQRIFAKATPLSGDGWNGTPVIVSGIVQA